MSSDVTGIFELEKNQSWLLGSDSYQLLLNQLGQGYSWLGTPDNPVTAVPDCLATTRPGRWLWLRDADDNRVWPILGPLANEETKISYGANRLVIERVIKKVRLTIEVRPGEGNELWQIKVENSGEHKRRLAVVLVTCWDGDGQSLKIDQGLASLTSTKQRQTETLTSRYLAARSLDSFETDQARFVGSGSWLNPDELNDGRLSRSLASQAPAAIGQFNLSLGPGASANRTIVIGATTTERRANESRLTAIKRLIKQTNQLTTKTLDDQSRLTLKIADNYAAISERLVAKSPEDYFNQALNLTLKNELLLTSLWFNDLAERCQAMLGLLLFKPLAVKEQLSSILANQADDGRLILTNHEGQSSSTDALWPTLLALEYLKESGDVAWLKSELKYYHGASASVLHHLTRAIEHGAAQELTNASQAGLVARVLQEFLPLLHHLGDRASFERYERLLKNTREQISKSFAGGYHRREQAMHLSDQAWPVLGGANHSDQRLVTAIGRWRSHSGLRSTILTGADASADLEQVNEKYYLLDGAWTIAALGRSGHGDEAIRVWRETVHGWPVLPKLLVPTTIGALPSAQQLAASSAAGAIFWATSQFILGLQPVIGGLKIEPSIPRDWRRLELFRYFRGATYHVQIDNPFRVSHGVERVIVDGTRIVGQTITPFNGGHHLVEVVLG